MRRTLNLWKMVAALAMLVAMAAATAKAVRAQGTNASNAANVNAADAPKDGYFTATDGVKIHYLTLGDRGSWVVLIHGYSDSARRMWFTTGIAPAIAKNHRVVAIDNRNHGLSDKPQPGGSGRAEDTIELMDHLHIQTAHIHGYSMGGGFVGTLLEKSPGRFITAGFGGSGMTETDPELRALAAKLDDALPKATGADAEAMDRFRGRVGAARTSGALGPAPGGAASTTGGVAASTPSAGRGAATSSTARGAAPSTARGGTPATLAATGAPGTSTVDLTKLNIPILGVNGAFDSPYGKTMRLWREVKVFHNVVLPGKTHLTAIAVGGPMPQQYVDEIARFIDDYDVK